MASRKSSSGSGRSRSAITGRFVTRATAKRSPRTTVTESTKARKSTSRRKSS